MSRPKEERLRELAMIAAMSATIAACARSADTSTSAVTVSTSSGGGATASSSSAGAGGVNATGMKRVFVTSSFQFSGNLGGLSKADATCTQFASGAGMGGSWKAWLSTASANATDRISGDGPWYRTDGVKAFNNKANLATTPLVTIDRDENGNIIGPQQHCVWTGTLIGGTAAKPTDVYGSECPATATANCQDWTVAGGCAASVGAPDGAATWTATTSGNPGKVSASLCSSQCRLYCFEQ